jgi:actin-related protein
MNTSVGRPKHVPVMTGAVKGDHFVGAKAESLRGLLKIKYPMEHGIVTDWADMEHIWSHAYQELKTSPEDVSWKGNFIFTCPHFSLSLSSIPFYLRKLL